MKSRPGFERHSLIADGAAKKKAMSRPTSPPNHGWGNAVGLWHLGLSQASESERPRKLKEPEEVPHPSLYPVTFIAYHG